ncbi:MAG: acyl carrier protein [Elusimicrobia bacterium]|nr:acyl carrier protein [Elusimicrobiota bacterium]
MDNERIGEVRRWLLRERPDIKEIGLDTDLIDDRVLDSVTFINFVYFMQELTGRRIPLASGTAVNSLRTLRRIQTNFLEGANNETIKVGV